MKEVVQCNQYATSYLADLLKNGAIMRNLCWFLLLAVRVLSSGCSQVSLGGEGHTTEPI